MVVTDVGADRRHYELCVLAELKNVLRAGDIWVQGSRQFKDFEDYLVPTPQYAVLKEFDELPLAVNIDCETYLEEPVKLLEHELEAVNRLDAANDLPDAIITDDGLTVTLPR